MLCHSCIIRNSRTASMGADSGLIFGIPDQLTHLLQAEAWGLLVFCFEILLKGLVFHNAGR